MHSLQSVQYSEFSDDGRSWCVKLDLDDANLLVGRNASGKTRTLNVIANAAVEICGNRKTNEGQYDLHFHSSESTIHYQICKSKGIVKNETFSVNSKPLLNRDENGQGTIFTKEPGRPQKFAIPKELSAIFAKRDFEQHDFLEPLFEWAEGVRHYRFSENLGHRTLIAITKDGTLADPKDASQSVGIFRRGLNEFGDKFKDQIISTMRNILYPITDITIETPSYVSQNISPDKILNLVIIEEGVESPIEQVGISTGMFRALAIIIHLTYAGFAKNTTCIIIDDIGEGLDFERSKRLSLYALHACDEMGSQLIMATNDRYIMNALPLEIWKGLRRIGGEVEVVSPRSAPDLFEDFSATGLSNFDFFSGHIFGANGD